MNLLALVRERLAAALTPYATPEELPALLELVRPSQDASFGDYQANLAMPLGKKLGRPPRDIAAEIVAALKLDDIAHPPEVAGPGFINVRLRDDWLAGCLGRAVADARLGVAATTQPRTFVIDYSAPNVAKPMHVGHIRSTVIGDALYRTLKFLGHRTISDNHLGDWGTQFGMIIYGYKHFRDEAAYQKSPVDELARLYRLVNRLVDYHEGRERLPLLRKELAEREADLRAEQAAPKAADPQEEKKRVKALKRLEGVVADTRKDVDALAEKLAAVESDENLAHMAWQHPHIGQAALQETAKLHEGDAENLRLWHAFLPPCREAINVVYRRLGVTFDETLGESFYHDQLAGTVDDLIARGIARESDGALCVFFDTLPVTATGGKKIDAPMIVRKKDGAFLYATTDLATIEYRMKRWQPDAILYVVDHRQSLHFEQLFATARLLGFDKLELQHVSFGTVLGSDGRPYKTRSGDTVGLTGLLDEAVSRAREIVSANDESKPSGADLSPERRQQIAETVGIAALKYADLSQNRTSDYTFSYDKMLAMNGNTATYMQYAYARVRSIFRRGQVDVEALRASAPAVALDAPAEQALARQLLRFEEALASVLTDYRPHQLTTYLWDLANTYSTFFEQCPVLKAETPAVRDSRLLLCDLTARTIKQGLELLGIGVVEQM
ncbi:MAG: arginine--tRNA ligase [Planctomycetes bacterium]|nr:arginine--tRNA ligase [Planctomycetota bacterium]